MGDKNKKDTSAAAAEENAVEIGGGAGSLAKHYMQNVLGDETEEATEEVTEEQDDATEGAEETTEEAEAEEAEENEATEDDAEAGDDDAEGDGDDEDQIQEEEIKGLTEGAQAAVNKRIGKITAKRKEAEEAAEAAEQRATEAETKLAEAETGKSAEEFAAATNLQLHPDYVSKEEIALIQESDKLIASEEWLAEHLDGYEGNGTDADPAYTAQEVRRRHVQVGKRLRSIQSKAESARENASKQMLEDMEAGRAARLGKPSKSAPAKKSAKKKSKPPVVPVAHSGTRKKPVSAKSKGAKGFSNETFEESGGGKDALVSEYERMLGG